MEGNFHPGLPPLKTQDIIHVVYNLRMTASGPELALAGLVWPLWKTSIIKWPWMLTNHWNNWSMVVVGFLFQGVNDQTIHMIAWFDGFSPAAYWIWTRRKLITKTNSVILIMITGDVTIIMGDSQNSDWYVIQWFNTKEQCWQVKLNKMNNFSN